MSTLKTNNIQHVDRSDPSIIISTDGGVSIAGTLTYEDVTSVDAVGIVTAREILNAQKQVHVGTGVSVKAGGLNVTAGITTVQALQATTGTFSGDVDIADKIIHTGDTDTAIRFPSANTVSVETAGVQKLSLSTNEVVFNDTGIDCDFRVEGDNNANALKLDAGSDRVAIGLASPNAPLHVYHASTNGVATFESGDTIALVNFKDNSTGSAYPALGAVGDDLKLLTGDAYRATIKSTGNFGIGTENPGLPLHIYHATSNGIILAESGDSNCGISLKDNGGEVSVRAIGNDLVLTTSSSETERVRIDANGRFLIGTTDAGTGSGDDLTISNSGNMGLTLRSTDSNYCNIYFSDATSGTATYEGYISYNHQKNQLEFATGHTERLVINNTGNAKFVGIVTATSFESTTFSKTPTNTPAFHAWSNNVTSHPLSDSTITKVTFLNSETFDTDSAFDNSTSGTTASRFTVPAGKGGYYQISAGLNFFANANDMRHCRVIVKQNTDIKLTSYNFVGGSADGDIRHFQANISGILQLAAGDYIELFGYLDTNGNTEGYISNDAQGYRGNHFSAYKLII